MARITPLHDRHRELGARMVEFAGYDMPVQYRGIMDEHRAVRTSAGMFDVCHMGEIEVSGREALRFIERMVTRRIGGVDAGRVSYGLLCNEDGGIIDDLTVYVRSSGFLLVVNAATAQEDYEWLTRHRDEWGMGAEITDVSGRTGKVDVQGPEAAGCVERALGVRLADLGYFKFREVPEQGMIASRSGYTGEDGFELYLPAGKTVETWDRLLAEGVRPCGLGARDTLRLEACLVLSGVDIGPEHDPFEAGLGWAVDLGKDELVGVGALMAAAERVEKEEASRILTPFTLEGRASARHGDAIFGGGQEVGRVTSGSFCPTLEKAAGMGYIAKSWARCGREIDVEARGRRLKGAAAERPLYKRGKP